jgi:predicted HicB family RNase H-like nuclease
MPTSKTKMVRLDADVIDQLKVVAAQRKTTVQTLVETAVLQWCRRQPETRRL